MKTTICFSEFNDVRSKCAQTITLQQFIDKLRSDHFRQPVTEYRRLRALAGCEAQAQAIKNRMPCIVPAGICFGGHAVTDLQQPSGIVCIDLDHTARRTAEIRQLAEQLPWVVAAFVSISGEGVKILALARAEDVRRGYAPLYAAVGTAISSHVQHPYDAACRTLTQPCFYSWDPDAYYNPNATAFPMPEPLLVPTSEPTPVTASVPAPSPQAQPLQTGAPITSDELLYRFLQRFDKQNPFVRGERNSVCLRLGRYARSNFFSQEDVERIISVYAGRYAVADFTEKDIRQRILAGYQHVARNEDTEQIHGKVQQGSGFTYEPAANEDGGEDTVDVLNKNDELRATVPCIPDEVYDLVPSFLKRCVQYASNPRERDTLLLGSIISCSALFPGVTFFYKDRLYSPHFYLAVVAPAGTGKGVLAFSNSLLDNTDEYYALQRRQLKKDYDEACLAWDEELRKAKKEHRKPDMELKPADLHPQYFKISATTSKSRLIESLAASGKIGCIMTSTEIITLTAALKQDCGAFDDILLKAFHHEEVSSSFKTDGEPLVARHPCLSVCLSGTQEQFATLFRSLETGLYSRFAFYTRAKEMQWVSCAPGTEGIDLKNYFHGLGDELLEMHKGLLQSPTYVTFTPRQWEEHTRHFGALLRKADAEGRESTAGIIFRCGLQTMRIAATFTIFRKWDDYRFAKEYTCTDDDFHAAMLIGRTLLEHSLLLSTSLPDSQQQPVAMHRFYRLDETLAALPATFSYTDFVNKAKELGLSRSTAQRMLKHAVKLQCVDKEDNVYSQKKDASAGEAIAEP
jgi:hypothetical protein